jgi:hypothetical protein
MVAQEKPVDETKSKKDSSLLQTLEPEAALRAMLTRVRRRYGKSRILADKLSAAVGQKITPHMLYNYTRKSKGHGQFPRPWLVPLYDITHDEDVLRFLFSERLFATLAIGEKVLQLPGILQDIEAGVARLTVPRPPKKNRLKRSRAERRR